MKKITRLLVLFLFLPILTLLGCSAPGISNLNQTDPTLTPRPTRTSAPTLTPTATETTTPTSSATPTATETALPSPTPTGVPATSTAVRPVATNTRRPLPPTATFTPLPPAAPTNTLAPSFAFNVSLGDTSQSVNCSFTAINGQIMDKGGNPLPGVMMHVSADGWKGADDVSKNSWQDGSTPTRRNAQVTLGSGYAKAGKWYVSVVDDTGKRLSNELAVFTDGPTNCAPKSGSVQVVPVLIRQN